MAGKPFRVEALLPVPARPYFLERDSAAFRSLLAKVLKIGMLECAGVWHEGASTFVKIITKPEFGSWVPKTVANQLQSSNLEFHDIIEFNPAHIASPPYTTFIRTESPFLKDKLDVRFTMTVEEVDGGAACRQVLEGHIRVRMFGVGRIIEGIVKDSLQNTYKKLPEIVRRWQMFREEALRSGDTRQLLLGRPPVGCEVAWIRQEVLAVLKEALPEDGGVSPASALCPQANASEESDDSPSAVQRSQQRIQQHLTAVAAAGGGQVCAAEAAAEAANVRAVGPGSVHASPAAAAPAAAVPDAAAAEGLPDAAAAAVGAVEAEEGALELADRRRSLYYDAWEGPMEWQASSSPRADAAAAGQAAEPEWQPAQPLPTWQPDDATPSPPPLSAAALAAAALARGASRHRRGLSTDSTLSVDTPLGEDGQPPLKEPGSRRYWRRFNRDYEEWGEYWDEVGVEQQEGEEGQVEAGGVVGRALHALEGLLRDSYFSTSMVLALFLLRHGWLRVEPDREADPHDEAHRQHAHHRHARSRSGAGQGLPEGIPRWDAEGLPPLPPAEQQVAAQQQQQQQQLARVAQEVYSRMVSGSRAVAAAPVRAVVAAGSGVRQVGTSLSSRMRPRSGDGEAGPASRPDLPTAPSSSGELGGDVLAPLPVGGDALALVRRLHHRKTMSLDTGTAAAAQQAAAEAEAMQRGAGAEGGSSAAAAAAAAGVSPSKEFLRRPSNLAQMTAMASMQRAEGHVRAPSRLACFSICGRAPAVKD